MKTPEGQGSGVKGQGYQQLLAWQRAHRLSLAVFMAIQKKPPPDIWLRNQCVRSAVSVGANIAEGYSRGSLREYIQFLNIARGSLAETEHHLLFLRDAGLIAPGAFEELEPLIVETGSILLGLLRSLERKEASQRNRLPQATETSATYAVGADADLLHPSPSTPHPQESP